MSSYYTAYCIKTFQPYKKIGSHSFTFPNLFGGFLVIYVQGKVQQQTKTTPAKPKNNIKQLTMYVYSLILKALGSVVTWKVGGEILSGT